MQIPSAPNKSRNATYLAATLALLASMLGCSQPTDDSDRGTAATSAPVATPRVDEPAEAPPAVSASEGGPSFEDYALPIPCRRTSDARETTSGGKRKNVIVFACRSHTAAAAADAIRTHMQETGYEVTEETEAASTTLVLRKQGTYKTTLRVSPDKKTDPATRSTVRVQWFSKD